MLVLSRRTGERLMIGNNAQIIIEVLNVQGGMVRLGIKAPKSVAVNREELYDRIKGVPLCAHCKSPDHKVSECDKVT
jgi:carbon storage regulator